MNLTCILIGQDNLLIQCAKHLLENHHEIKWVVSPVESIQTWCDKNNIPWVSSLSRLPDKRENSVDYLFSIVNGVILKNADLKIARFGTINYHDSMLPKYAGVHATSWAIINGETTHGITWHMVDEGIDEGDIVYQKNFSLSKNETALTLNLRCFDEAAIGFSEIIRMIQSSSLTRRKQSKEGRTYYGLTHPLPDLGFINWQTGTSEYIESLCRAVNFGNYKNTLGTVKLLLKDNYLIVLEVEKSNQSCAIPQGGRVLSIEKNGLSVSTIDGSILITKLMTSQGKLITTDECIQFYDLNINDQLPLLDRELSNSHNVLYSDALSNEKYWVDQLFHTVDHTIYSDRLFKKDNSPAQLSSIEIDPAFKNKLDSPHLYLLAAIFIYLYRLNNYENSTIFLNQNSPSSSQTGLQKLWSTLLPMTPNLQSDFTCKHALEEISRVFDLTIKHGHYLNDIHVRQPSLLHASKECMITLECSNQKMNAPEHSLIHFHIDQKKNKLSILHQLNVQFQGGTITPLIENMSAHINNILQNMLHDSEKTLHNIVFLTEEEQNKLFAWGVGEYIPLPSNTITELFEQSVHRTPHHHAIHQDHQSITYHQLWQKAEKITSFINTLNAEPQALIGIHGDQGMDMIACILGIMKAGCVCVPLSTHDPITRLNPIAVEHKLRHVMTLQPCANHNASFEIHNVLSLFSQNSTFDSLPNRSSPHQESIILIDEKNGGYKKLTQKNLINYGFWLNQNTRFTGSSILHLPSHLPLNTFLLYFFGSLFTSGTLSITTTDFQKNANDYLDHLQNKEVSHLTVIREKCKILTDHSHEIRQFNKLSHFLLTTDADSVDQASEWLSLYPDHQFIVISETQSQ